MMPADLTGRLRNALLAEPALAGRAREQLRCAIGGLDLASEECHLARDEARDALRGLCEEVSGLGALDGPAGQAGTTVPAVLAGALESVDFEAMADELVTEIEGGRE